MLKRWCSSIYRKSANLWNSRLFKLYLDHTCNHCCFCSLSSQSVSDIYPPTHKTWELPEQFVSIFKFKKQLHRPLKTHLCYSVLFFTNNCQSRALSFTVKTEGLHKRVLSECSCRNCSQVLFPVSLDYSPTLPLKCLQIRICISVSFSSPGTLREAGFDLDFPMNRCCLGFISSFKNQVLIDNGMSVLRPLPWTWRIRSLFLIWHERLADQENLLAATG